MTNLKSFFKNPCAQFLSSIRTQLRFRTVQVLVLASVALCFADTVRAQAPALLWTTNAGARVFAVDELTNVYVGTNGTVIELDSDGVPLQTNVLGLLPGLAQRDAAGNFYYAGVRPGFDSGGIFQYGSTNACFLAKFTSAGTLVWSNGFGSVGSLRGIAINDLQVDTNGNAYAAFTYYLSTFSHSSTVAKFDNTGSNLWTIAMPGYGSSTTVGSVRIANVSVAGGYALTYDDGPIGGWDETLSRFDSNGAPTVITNWVTSRIGFPPPVVDSQGNFYSMENLPSQLPVSFIKHTPSGLAIWGKDFGYTTQILVGRDFYDGAHVADTNSHLSRYDLDGNLVWTMSLPSNCQEMFVDGSGNRFVSLLGGAIARIGDETFSALSITNAPQPLTVLAGSNAVLSVGASGSTPLRYFWYFNNSLLSAQTNAPLNLFPATTNQSGSYYVVVSNQVNSVTSAPVQLRVKQVELFIGGQLLTNGTYTFLTNPIITVQSDFTNGSVFYTLDGSAPTFLSTPYSGPFGLFSNATVRALGYSADFSHSEEADAVDAIVLAHHSLVASSPGGGSITLNPPGGDYLSSTTVTATAVPDAGWSFLHWTGAATGANPSVEILMHSDQSLHAVFGTTLSTTVQGDGQVLLYPPGGFYSYGQIVRLTGVPNAGSYFGAWGNAASGNTNPLYFTVTNSNPTVSSIFGTNGANQVSLSVLINGRGDVNVSPSANVYTAGQSVTLSATAGPGQSFANWSGDAGGSQNPLTVVLNQGKVITANFSGGPILRVNSQLGEGMNLDGFRFSLLSDSGSIYEIRSSTNLKSWQSMGYVTNQTGEMQLLDSAGTNSPQKFYRTFP